MANFSNNNYERNSRKKTGGKHQDKDKTMSEFAEEVKQNYFSGDIYTQLLKIQSNDSEEIKKLDLDKILEALEKYVKDFASGVTTSQIRNVYAKTIQAKTAMDLKLLRPNLAYVAARQDNPKAKKMMAFIDDLIKHVEDNNVKSFHKIMETIVAYHKYYNK